jgi:hypothetical protein
MSSIRPKVIARLQSDLSDRFRVVDNTGTDKTVLAGKIPDVILYKKVPPNSTDVLFVMRVENGGELTDSLAQWKEMGKLPSTFYIVVPKAKLDEAKKLANATSVNARFAWYVAEANDVTELQYE